MRNGSDSACYLPWIALAIGLATEALLIFMI